MADQPSRVLNELGLLLLSDKTLPSVATIVVGEPIRGSWWGHPKSHEIFHAARLLGADANVIAIPLIGGKITFVHRRLWPALLTLGLAREPWQTLGIDAGALTLLKRVEREGEVESSGGAVHALERRLLVVSREVHTRRGAHAKIIESWQRWAQRLRVTPLEDVSAARREVETAAAALGTRVSLPWDRRPAR